MRDGNKERQWEKAQIAEAKSWASLASNLNSDKARAWKEEFWKKYLEVMDWHLDEHIRRYNRLRILDVGCGPSSVLLYLNKLSDDLIMTGLDPLMDHYLDISPRLKEMPVEWVSVPFEDFKTSELFNIVFALNSIDHCRAISGFLKQLCKVVVPEGEVWISVNCHTKGWQAWIWRKLKLEALYPYHHTAAEYAEMFRKYFHIKKTCDVTCTLFDLKSGMPESTEQQPLRSRWKRLFRLRGLLRRLLTSGIPVFPSRPGQKSVYRTVAFLLTPHSNE